MTTQTRDATIVRLDEPSAADEELAGGKAAALARLTQHGFAVPPGFVLTTDACTQVLDAMPASPTDDQSRLDLPRSLRDAVDDALARLGPGRLAVRSSGVSEDQAGASFAGQYETVLGVEGTEEVLDAIRTVLASAFTSRVVAYRAARGASDDRLAVLVQRLVDTQAAGVAFSANPMTGDRTETLVSAVRGLGERLVSGEATPDEYVVRGADVETVARPEGAVDERQVREIAALADRLEDLFGRPQDIEWAWSESGLWLLQSRPITALPVPPDVDVPEGTWMKDRTHHPEPITPLGASVYIDALSDGMRPTCREWGLLVDGVEQLCVGGEVYMRPVPLGGKDGGPTPPWWLVAVLARVVPPLRRRMKAAERTIGGDALVTIPRRWEEEWRPQIRSRVGELRAVDLESLSDDELDAHLERVIELMRHGQRLHFRLFLPYGIGVHELAKLAEELLGWTTGQTMHLLQGLSTASSEPARALRGLADLVREHPEAQAVIEDAGEDLLAALEEVDADVAEAVRTYRDEWGLRTVNYDPGSPTLIERPALLGRLVRDAIRDRDAAPRSDVHGAREQARARVERELDVRGIGASDRRRFEEALDYAERVYPLREDNVFWADNVPNALVRLTTVEIGRRLADRDVLDTPEDAVWLEIDELRALLSDAGAENRLGERIERRKAERRYVRANPGPEVLGPEPSPPPDVRGLPEAGRRTNATLLWLMDLEGFDGGSDAADAADLAGTPASAGRYTGPVRVVRGEDEFERLRPGDVLVCPITTPAWSVLFAHAAAVVTDGGGVLSHAAIIAREHGIPAVLGTGDATRRLRDEMVVTVDGSTGTITIEKENA